MDDVELLSLYMSEFYYLYSCIANMKTAFGKKKKKKTKKFFLNFG